MSRINSDERQLKLDFSFVPDLSGKSSLKSKVVYMNSYVNAHRPMSNNPEVLHRLLNEAKKLRW